MLVWYSRPRLHRTTGHADESNALADFLHEPYCIIYYFLRASGQALRLIFRSSPEYCAAVLVQFVDLRQRHHFKVICQRPLRLHPLNCIPAIFPRHSVMENHNASLGVQGGPESFKEFFILMSVIPGKIYGKSFWWQRVWRRACAIEIGQPVG